MPKDMTGLRKVGLQAPDFLEGAFGYQREGTRFVAFYWIPYGDELCFTDDEGASGTINHQAWLLFKRHLLIETLLQGYDFGSSEEEAVHWLLLDRERRELWAGKKEDVQRLLTPLCVPKLFDMKMVFEEAVFEELFEKVREGLENMPLPTGREIMAAMQEEYLLCERFRAWLDGKLGAMIEKADEL